MSISPEVLRPHWEYCVWATTRLLVAADQLFPEELTRDFKTADRSVLGTLIHLFRSEKLWLARFRRQAAPTTLAGETQPLSELQAEWPRLQEEWRQFLSGLSDSSALLTYTDLKGNEWTQPYWQLMLHVVNHGTHHRGQVSGFIRAMGHVPPTLDLVAYYRQQVP